jgi:2-polyprenyl-3-methyl-5-hydroxy-6-metoxy-1,4-benzoquinol methylase
MKTVLSSCRVCGSVHTRSMFDVASVGIMECQSCGFRFPQAIPSDQQLRDHYNSGYNETRFLQGQRVNALINKRILDRVIGPLKGLAILDVGAGYGFLAHSLNKPSNYSCDAVELSEPQRAYARNYLGIKAYSSLAEVDRQYDLIVSFEVLEHIPDPVAFLSSIAALLNPGGALILGTDHFSSPTVQSMGASFPKWVPHEHISCFTPSSITKLYQLVPSLELETLQTYASWELRTARLLYRLAKGAPASQNRVSNSAKSCSAYANPPLGMRKYKFYQLRRAISPFVAGWSLSNTLNGEMLIVKATKV